MWNDKPIPRGFGITDQLEAFQTSYVDDITLGLAQPQTSGSQSIRSINLELNNLNKQKGRPVGRTMGVLKSMGRSTNSENFSKSIDSRPATSYISASQIGTVKQ